MALPLHHNEDLQSCSPPFKFSAQSHCEGGQTKPVFGGCHRSAMNGSYNELESFGSEAGSLTMLHEDMSLRCDEDSFCTAPGSPVGMLHCNDSLDEDDYDEDATREWAPGRPAAVVSGSVYHHSDAQEILCNELSKEAELGAFTATPIPPQYRSALVYWMRDVCGARALCPATFFSSVSLMDRFLRAAGEGATPPTLLQLVALTCVSVAAKSEQQQCAGELLSLARDENGNLYKGEDSRMMELHLLDLLDWRLRVPTVHTFASLLLHRVINRPQDGLVVPPGSEARFRELVMHLAELAVLDYELTSVPFSVLAVACLLIAETEVKGGHMQANLNLKTVDSMRTVPGMRDLTALSGPVQRLYGLYMTAAAAAASSPTVSL